MGRIPIGFLWIFFRKYSFEVLCLTGGLQNSYHGFRRKPFFSSSSNLLFIRSFSLCVIFSLSDLYVVWSVEVFHCFCCVFTPILDYNCRALFIISIGLLMSWFRACRSFLVRLSDLFCLCLCSFMISSLTLCRRVSNVPLSVNLSEL